MKDGLHVVVVDIQAVIEMQEVFITSVGLCLVEHAQHLVKPVVDLPVQTRYLYDDAVVGQTVDKGIGESFGHPTLIVVVGFVMYVDDGFFYIAHLMA